MSRLALGRFKHAPDARFQYGRDTEMAPHWSNTQPQTPISWHRFQDNLGKMIPETDFNEARDDGVAVASAEPYGNHLHITADR